MVVGLDDMTIEPKIFMGIEVRSRIFEEGRKEGVKEELSRQRFEQGKLNINFVKFLRKEISGTEFALAMEQRIKDMDKRLSELEKELK